MEFEEQIKFQESTTVVASWDVNFCVKVDDDIHEDAALDVYSKEPTKKKMMIFQEPILDEDAISQHLMSKVFSRGGKC